MFHFASPYQIVLNLYGLLNLEKNKKCPSGFWIELKEKLM